MTEVIKPIPSSTLHQYNDDVLSGLIKRWREDIETGKIDEPTGKRFIDDIYKVLGYRCALEYLEKYGD